MADDRLPALEEIRRREQEAIPGPWLAREVYREGKPRWQLALGNDPYKRLLIDAPKSETWPGTTTGEFIARSREDVPRLLAALDAVLEQHETKPYYLAASECEHPEPSDDADEWTEWDSDHPPGTGDVGRICLLTQIASYCPGCTEMTYGDEPWGEEYVSAPCVVRAAITRALTGETDGG